jgi:hypothetical protein
MDPYAEAEAVACEGEDALDAPLKGWDSTAVFNAARKVTRHVRGLMAAGNIGPLFERLLIIRGSLLSRLARIQRSDSSAVAFLNQCRENYSLLDQHGQLTSLLLQDTTSVHATLDFASFNEACASFAGDPRQSQRGIVAVQVRGGRQGCGWLAGSSGRGKEPQADERRRRRPVLALTT